MTPGTMGGGGKGEDEVSMLPSPLLPSRTKKGKQREKTNSFKGETIKRLSITMVKMLAI